VTRRAAALVCAIGLLAGCATHEWIYERPGTTPAKLERDMAICRKEAPDHQTVSLPGSERTDRVAFNRCMERKGYRARMVEKPR